MRVVIDTNVLVSASLFQTSIPYKVVVWCLNDCEIYFSENTQLELSSRITREKFDRYQSLEKRQAFVKDILDAKQVSFCRPQEKIIDSPDPNDNQFLEVAVEVKADYLITGDKKHLLPMNPYRGTQIVTPREFLRMSNGIETF